MVSFFKFPRAKVNAVDNRVEAGCASALGWRVSVDAEAKCQLVGVSFGGLTHALLGQQHSAGSEVDLRASQLDGPPQAALVAHAVAIAGSVCLFAGRHKRDGTASSVCQRSLPEASAQRQHHGLRAGHTRRLVVRISVAGDRCLVEQSTACLSLPCTGTMARPVMVAHLLFSDSPTPTREPG